METEYFVVSTSEDGASLERLGQSELLKRLNEHYWGTTKRVWTRDDLSRERGRIDLTATSCLIIIRGAMVAPKPKSVVVEWEL